MSTTASVAADPVHDITARLAQYAANLQPDDIEREAMTAARHCILDWLGVAIAGSEDKTARILRQEASEQGGNPQASVVGAGMSSVLQAALINGTAGHALDYDDVHYAMPGHPTAAVAPAVLAIAEREGTSGREALAAFVAGVEVACRVGHYVTSAHYDAGWHATGTLGTFGAAAGAARVLGLDAQRTAVALGIAGTQAAGLKSMFGTMCKPMHAGKAAANGLHAALLAARGFSARPDVLECAQGFGATQSSEVDAGAAVADLGGPALVRQVLFKYHAACYGTHATIEAARSLVTSQSVAAERIANVEIQVKPRYLRMCDIAFPETGLEAKFSLRMTCAMALSNIDTGAPSRYDAELCRSPELRALLERTTVVANPDLDDAVAELIVTLDDGVVYRVRGDVSKPDADLDRQGGRLASKFDTLVTPVLGTGNAPELRDMLAQLADLNDLRALMALTRA